MSSAPPIPFGATKAGLPILDLDIPGGINPGISYNMSYAIWDAAIAAGASLDELMKIEQGEYPGWFVSKVVAWHIISKQIKNHVEHAKSLSLKKG